MSCQFGATICGPETNLVSLIWHFDINLHYKPQENVQTRVIVKDIVIVVYFESVLSYLKNPQLLVIFTKQPFSRASINK
jgi:hypothetical protein